MHANIIGFNPLLAELPASPTRAFHKSWNTTCSVIHRPNSWIFICTI